MCFLCQWSLCPVVAFNFQSSLNAAFYYSWCIKYVSFRTQSIGEKVAFYPQMNCYCFIALSNFLISWLLPIICASIWYEYFATQWPFLQGYHSLQSYRVSHALWNQGRKILALALQSRISEVNVVVYLPFHLIIRDST